MNKAIGLLGGLCLLAGMGPANAGDLSSFINDNCTGRCGIGSSSCGTDHTDRHGSGS